MIWLGRGIAGDDTHGHVDDLARFVDPRTVVAAVEPTTRRPELRAACARTCERLAAARPTRTASRSASSPLPMPAPVVFDGQRLPASYANFYIANGLVLVPTFNDPADRVALEHPGRRSSPTAQVVGIHAVDLVWGSARSTA